MNERNVAALEKLVSEWEAMDFKSHGRGTPLAEFLASRGVLVPSALTDEDIEFKVWDEGTRYETGEDHQDFAKPNPAGMRAALEYVAKLEAA